MMLICPHSGLGNQIGNYVFGQFLLEKEIDVKFLFSRGSSIDMEFALDKFKTDLRPAAKEDIEQFLNVKNPPFLYKNLIYNMIFKKKYYFNSLYKVLSRIRTEYSIYPAKTPALMAKIASYRDILADEYYKTAVCDCYNPIEEFNNENFKEKMISHFVLKEPLNDDNKRVLDKIKNAENPIGIHIRRRNYLELKMPVLTLTQDFILEKMNFLNKNLDNTHFFVFSNGQDWARKHILGFKNVDFVDINSENACYFDFALMNECKHRIYSASSFSKWLKYLNPNKNSFEFMPDKEDLIVE